MCHSPLLPTCRLLLVVPRPAISSWAPRLTCCLCHLVPDALLVLVNVLGLLPHQSQHNLGHTSSSSSGNRAH